MFFLIGLVVVFGSVAGGYAMHHGHFGVLWQPNEFVIIFGAAVGAFVIANPPSIVKGVLKSFKNLFKSKPYGKKEYLELLGFMFTVFKLMKTKGMLEIESHIENPHESDIFKKYPKFLHNHHAVEFFCDYTRLMTMGVDNSHHAEDLMDKELEVHHHEALGPSAAVSGMADGMPALGIVAAVLGVITTMGSIKEPPEILGGLIGAALVGTFLGVLMAYGVIGPIGSSLNKFAEAEGEFFKCMKAGIIAHMQGNAPTVSIEYARKVIPMNERPSFQEVEKSISEG